MTETDKNTLNRITRYMNSDTRKPKIVIVRTYFKHIADNKNRTYTKSNVPMIRMNSMVQDKIETELQTTTNFKKIQLRGHLPKRVTAVVKLRVLQFMNFVLILMVLLQESTANNQTQTALIKWKLMTQPVYFGSDVNLECTIQTMKRSAPMAWVRIPNGETIAYNNISADHLKYGVTVKYYDTTTEYILTIKHFDLTDSNRVYRCDYGYQSYGDKILLNDILFDSNVVWNMKTNPAIIGNDVILECVISGEGQSCDKYPRQWYGGVNYGFLCEDGMCRNNKKYKEVTISSCKHHLVIRNFTEQDLNQIYTCSYGIVNDRKGLALKDGRFELHPSKKSLHDIIKVSDKSISVHIQMLKVYPMPRCTFTYKETNITKYVQESVETVGSFFKVNFTLNYPINDHCKDEIMIVCTIGTYQMNTSDSCQEVNRQSGFSDEITVGIVVGVACIIAFVGVALVLHRRSPSGHTQLPWIRNEKN